MLIKCPECQLQVSDRAWSCPHCGYPLKPDKQPRRSTRRKRLPNGFGQISEIKGKNLRKPFRVLVTVGKDENGRPICKSLKPEAYFKTYNEAYTALVEYNKNPYDISQDITMSELFERWSKTERAAPSIKIWTPTWKYCTVLYDMKVTEIRSYHLKQCINDGCIMHNGEKKYLSPNLKIYAKILFNMLFDYAVEYEIVDKNPARNFSLPQVNKEKDARRKKHIAYTDDELKLIWENINNYEAADMVLIQCYTGWRPQELCNIELEHIDFENMLIFGGMKTEAGINRIVPIHSKIYQLVKNRYDDAIHKKSKYLFNNNKWISVSRFQYLHSLLVDGLNINRDHRPHDGRVTFVTRAKQYGVDEYAIKRIVGHSIKDISILIITSRFVLPCTALPPYAASNMSSRDHSNRR